MKAIWYKKKVFSLLLVFTGFLGWSQENLSFQEALNKALSNNFDIQIANNETQSAELMNNWGQAGRFPLVTTTLTQPNSLRNNQNPASFLQGNIISNGANANLDASWTIFNGFKVKFTKEQLELLQEQSENNADLIIENTIYATAIAYFNCVIEQKRLTIVEQSMQQSKEKFLYSQSGYELGVVKTTDYLQLQSAFYRDSSNYIRQKNNAKNAVFNLNLILASEISTNYSFTDSINIKTYEPNLDTVSLSLTANNRQIRNMMLNKSLAQKQTEISKSSLYPSLRLNLGADYNSNRVDIEGRGVNKGTSYDFYANFTLGFTLFNGGKIRREILKNILAEEKVEISIEKTKSSLTTDLEREKQNLVLQEQLYQVNLLEGAVIERQLKLAEENLKAGLITALDFRDIQLNSITNGFERSQIELSYLSTQLKLLQLTGNLLNTVSQ